MEAQGSRLKVQSSGIQENSRTCTQSQRYQSVLERKMLLNQIKIQLQQTRNHRNSQAANPGGFLSSRIFLPNKDCFSLQVGVFQSRSFPRKGFPNNKKIFSKKFYLTRFQEYQYHLYNIIMTETLVDLNCHAVKKLC